jgi:signal peptidase I
MNWFKKEKKEKKPETFGEFLRSIGVAIFVAVLIRTFAFQPFIIPSGSMKPNLLIHDFLFVSKYAYGYSKYAFPFSPNLFSGRIFFYNKPQIGDVVVFRGPYDPDIDYIKRVVGLPGDRIQMRDGVLFINDKPCPLKSVGEFTDDLWTKQLEGEETDILVSGKGLERHIPMFIETLPNGVKHLILKKDPFGEGRLDNTQAFVVPEGHYFMMGDNRDESGDSRVPKQIGYVPEENLIGEAAIIWFSTTARWWEFWKWPTDIRYNRLFKVIS